MRNPSASPLRIGTHVQDALSSHRGVVALETTLIAHGLPSPDNIAVALELEEIVRKTGAIPATVGVIEGVPIIGLSVDEIERIATKGKSIAKLSSRDLGAAVARRLDGATTVAGTIALAVKAGIEVMATGGLGGVHRNARDTPDESADLLCLHETPMLVIASGVKSILDVGATLERLETLAVPVVGFGTNRFPGFYVCSTDYALDWAVGSIEEAVAGFIAHRQLAPGGMLIANPVRERDQLDVATHDAVVANALRAAQEGHVTGKEVTPFLLSELASNTGGESVRANRALLRNNAELAGGIARELRAGGRRRERSPVSTTERMRVPRVVVLGDVMTDIVVRLTDAIAPFSDTPAKITLSPGGSATNEAVWLARGGIAVDLVAVVGDDELGRDSLRELRGEGIAAHVTTLKGRTSGVVVSVVDPDGRRSMLTDRGANLGLAAARIPAALFRSGDHLHISGYEFFDEQTRVPALELVRRADEVGMTKSIDPCSSGPLSRVGSEAFFSWTKGFDVCCANLDEGKVLSSVDEPNEVAAFLTEHYPVVALTLSDKGALCATRRGPTETLAPVPTDVVDTTGAGDAFCGSFLAAWLHGRPPSEALRAGLEASAFAVATVGARPRALNRY